jgi:hypothetical protein
LAFIHLGYNVWKSFSCIINLLSQVTYIPNPKMKQECWHLYCIVWFSNSICDILRLRESLTQKLILSGWWNTASNHPSYAVVFFALLQCHYFNDPTSYSLSIRSVIAIHQTHMPAVFHTAYLRGCAVTMPTAITQNGLSVVICDAIKKKSQYIMCSYPRIMWLLFQPTAVI